MLGRFGIALSLWKMGRLAWRLFADGRVPLSAKLVLPAGLAYVLFPLDMLPDVFPGLGQLDDLTVLLASVTLFLRLCPTELVREHLGAMAGRRPKQDPAGKSGRVIDGDYEILD